MFRKLNDDELKKINEVIKITGGDYELNNNYISIDGLISAIEDLLVEIHRQEEKYNDLEKEIEENYKPIPYAEQIGYNERDFY